MSINPQKARHFRAIGHKLKPLVTVAGKGLSDAVINEIERALNDHELIKVSIKVGDRAARAEICRAICERCNASLVQQVGNVALIFRAATQPNPKLSNLLRNP